MIVRFGLFTSICQNAGWFVSYDMRMICTARPSNMKEIMEDMT